MMNMTIKSGLPLTRFAELAMRSAADEAEYVAGRKVAYQVLRVKERAYKHPGSRRMGRKPHPVESDRGERFESMHEAEEALGLSHGQIHYAVRTGAVIKGRRWTKVGVGA